ncbi:hypothetical protein [Streptomyces sp. NBC_00872]|uniref:hypothetical protein n=1 Tax=Streptomyces sp. NBC_00872 TaxID=2903686 RepID=UPI003866DEFD|nr:hypothetical protein OG214_30715 [Streptomyces sp. NBC_00872]
MSYSGRTPDGSDRDAGGNGDSGTRIDVRGDGQSRIRVAGRDMNTTYFVSASSAALAALVGLVILVGMWQPWQETASTGEQNRADTGIGSGPSGGPSTDPAPYREPPPADEDDKESEDPEPSPSPTPTPSASPSPSPSPTPDPPDPVDVAFASARVGTCLNVYDDGWGKLNHDWPFAVDCGATFAFSKVTMVTTSASNCPQGAGRRGWGHVNDDGSSIALCLDRVFAAGQCFPATLSKQADGSLRGEGRLFSVWGCDRTQVPSGLNAIMTITAVLRGGGCPQRNDRQTLSWPVFNGAGKVCAVQRTN